MVVLNGHWNGADVTIVARLVNRYFNSVPKSAKGSIELLKSSCMVQSKQPINRFALPVQAPHKFSSDDILSRKKSVKLDF